MHLVTNLPFIILSNDIIQFKIEKSILMFCNNLDVQILN